ncbi:hypothetical protein KA005_56595, partial [bacterium]|nr:hypothetical protein [bacterium]
MRPLLKGYLIVIMFTCVTLATTINVPADQPTIQAGIDAAIDGDTVLVQPGTYGENIDFGGKNIVVGSLFLTTGDASYISNTLITGADYKVYRVVYFAGGEDSTAVLNGFTITKDSTYFGAIECNAGSGPTLMNLILSGNKALVDFAGGITCKNGSSPTLVNITIRGSSGTFGGGISCMNSRMKLINVTISDDSASIMGGGILCWDSEMTLVNVTIVGNKCSSNHVRGGGIECRGSESEMILVNTIVWNNSSPEIYISYSDSDLVEAFNCDIKGGWDGFGNINADPMFVDAANGDYRLQEGSPCIDEGTDFFVWQGDTI